MTEWTAIFGVVGTLIGIAGTRLLAPWFTHRREMRQIRAQERRAEREDTGRFVALIEAETKESRASLREWLAKRLRVPAPPK